MHVTLYAMHTLYLASTLRSGANSEAPESLRDSLMIWLVIIAFTVFMLGLGIVVKDALAHARKSSQNKANSADARASRG